MQLKKVMEEYETSKADVKDTTKKLHDTNKARHEIEIKLLEEINTSKEMRETIRNKDEKMAEKDRHIDDLDKKALEMNR